MQVKPCRSAHTRGSSSTAHRVTVLKPHAPRLQPIRPPRPATPASHPSSWFPQRLLARSLQGLLTCFSDRALPGTEGPGQLPHSIHWSFHFPDQVLASPPGSALLSLTGGLKGELPISACHSPSSPRLKATSLLLSPRTETTGARGTEDARPTSPRGPLRPQGPPL